MQWYAHYRGQSAIKYYDVRNQCKSLLLRGWGHSKVRPRLYSVDLQCLYDQNNTSFKKILFIMTSVVGKSFFKYLLYHQVYMEWLGRVHVGYGGEKPCGRRMMVIESILCVFAKRKLVGPCVQYRLWSENYPWICKCKKNITGRD